MTALSPAQDLADMLTGNGVTLAVDLFAWGIYRKHEVGDTEW